MKNRNRNYSVRADQDRLIRVNVRKEFGQAGVDAFRAILTERGFPDWDPEQVKADPGTAQLFIRAVRDRLETPSNLQEPTP